MGRSWGHTVRPLTPDEIAEQAKIDERYGTRRCRASTKCKQQSCYMLRYSYVTGARGRVSYQEKPICENHAAPYLTGQYKGQVVMVEKLPVETLPTIAGAPDA